MWRTASILVALVISTAAVAQTAPTDSQTLQALLAEVRQLRRDLQTSSTMAARAQIALYRLQQENEAVVRARERVNDLQSKVTKLESDKNVTVNQIRALKVHFAREDADAQQRFEEETLPNLNSNLELTEKQEQQARAEESAAEQALRDEQTKLDELNDTLDRLNAALEDASRK